MALSEVTDSVQSLEILILRPDNGIVQSRRRQDCTISEREFELDAQPGSFERQVGIEIDYQTLSHLTDHVERGVLSLLAQHSLEDLEKTDGRDYQTLDSENRRLKRMCVRSTVDIFEPA